MYDTSQRPNHLSVLRSSISAKRSDGIRRVQNSISAEIWTSARLVNPHRARIEDVLHCFNPGSLIGLVVIGLIVVELGKLSGASYSPLQ